MKKVTDAESFNDWFKRIYKKDSNTIYRLFKTINSETTKKKTEKNIAIPVRFRKGHKLLWFRKMLLIYFNLFINDLQTIEIQNLPKKQESFKCSPFKLDKSQCDPSGNAVGIFSNFEIPKRKILNCFSVIKTPLTQNQYQLLIKQKNDSLIELPRRNIFGCKERSKSNKQQHYVVGGPIKFLNHACSPYHNLNPSNNWKKFTVMQKINPGDELFINYGNNYFTEKEPCTNPFCKKAH